ncbi:hypothetical protein BU200_07460 [Streptococcus acidominimus]|uniref:Uncharacterized protein n=1 Tax=Streptococcus acidominimus TaxID=1326 RepID=A0A1Q8EC95_STRAI|nr:hypothetical protein BU200_07460 [Streptococcus acidominimus]
MTFFDQLLLSLWIIRNSYPAYTKKRKLKYIKIFDFLKGWVYNKVENVSDIKNTPLWQQAYYYKGNKDRAILAKG